jgi:hypothetical protein
MNGEGGAPGSGADHCHRFCAPVLHIRLENPA